MSSIIIGYKKEKLNMAETRYCYTCHCRENKDVKMDFYPGKSIYGTYKCPECSHEVDKKEPGDTGEKYI